jgi:hypothetical protein
VVHLEERIGKFEALDPIEADREANRSQVREGDIRIGASITDTIWCENLGTIY